MYIPSLSQGLAARSTGGGSGGTTKLIVIIVVVTVVGLATALLVLFLILRILRKLNYAPKYIPGKYLKKKWEDWRPGISYGQVPNRSNSPVRQDTSYRGAAATPPPQNNANVRRDTSIRSIITLPSYSFSPKPTEQVIAREGERGGMDVVVEFPETADEEEAHREEHMEALYQVRLQRRQEYEEREARRRERREALARGDYNRLEQLRQQHAREGRERSGSGSSNLNTAQATQLALQRSRERQRRISSVSYAALGYVRHDGSRVRANSAESDHNPLLQIVESNEEGRNPSVPSLPLSSGDHLRGGSVSSISTAASDGENLAPVESNVPLTHIPTAEHDEEDVANLRIPPPDYDHLDWGDAPAYEDPNLTEARDSLLRTVPTIHIDMVRSDRENDAATSESSEHQPSASETTEQHQAADPPSQSRDSEPASSLQGEATNTTTGGGEDAAPQLPAIRQESPIEFNVPGYSEQPTESPANPPAEPPTTDSSPSPHPTEQHPHTSINTTEHA